MAFPTIPAQTANNVYAATMQEYSSEVKDQSFNKMPASKALWKNKGSGTLGNGRHEFRCETGLNTNAGTAQNDAVTATFSQQSNHVVGWYDYMAFNYVPVQQSLIRNSQNSGAAQIFSLVKADMRIAEKSMRRLISSQTFGDGSNQTIIGLTALLPSTGVGTNTLFNISEIGNAWWKNVVSTSAGSFLTYGHHGSSGNDKLLTQHLNCSDSGADFPDLMISDRTVWQYRIAAEGLLVRNTKDADYARIGNSAVTGNAGEGIPYYGSMWTWDNECPTGYVYSIHTENVRMIEDPNFNFRWIPVNMGQQFLLTGSVLTYRSQSEMTRRNDSGVQTGWTP